MEPVQAALGNLPAVWRTSGVLVAQESKAEEESFEVAPAHQKWSYPSMQFLETHLCSDT